MEDFIRKARLGAKRAPEAVDYTSSLGFDDRIFKADIMVDYAHVIMLVEKRVIDAKDGVMLVKGLKKIEELGYESLRDYKELEDVHAVIEAKLIEMLSEEVGGKLHTARSRNDEVATCLRITLREKLLDILDSLLDLQTTILDRARAELHTIMPGFTHGQMAQPTTLAHYLLAHFDAFTRDAQRLLQAYERVNKSPLGSGALATTGFPIDRNLTAELLGFEGLVENSLDAVSTRDFIVESLAAISILMCNISRLAEDLIIWSSEGLSMIELADEYTSTSSIMPQKKNPDVLELARAKVGRVYGDLLAALTMLKAIPTAYDRDLQELTPRLWDGVEEAESTIKVIKGVMASMKVKREVMFSHATKSFITMTELADLLVRRAGLPFRKAHEVVGLLVKEALERKIEPSQLDAKVLDYVAEKVLKRRLGLKDSEVAEALSLEEFVKKRSVIGGPSPSRVADMLESRRRALACLKDEVLIKRKRIDDAKRGLMDRVEALLKQNPSVTA